MISFSGTLINAERRFNGQGYRVASTWDCKNLLEKSLRNIHHVFYIFFFHVLPILLSSLPSLEWLLPLFCSFFEKFRSFEPYITSKTSFWREIIFFLTFALPFTSLTHESSVYLNLQKTRVYFSPAKAGNNLYTLLFQSLLYPHPIKMIHVRNSVAFNYNLAHVDGDQYPRAPH